MHVHIRMYLYIRCQVGRGPFFVFGYLLNIFFVMDENVIGRRP